MEVRPARPEEYQAVGALTLAAYQGVAGMPIGEYAAVLLDAASRAAQAELLVAAEDGDLLGGVTYVPGPGPYAEFDDADAAGIRMLAVADAARGRGVGAALVAECVRRATAAGRARIVLHTTEWMVAAHRLYERLGFARAPERDWEPEPGLVLLAYVRQLAGRYGSGVIVYLDHAATTPLDPGVLARMRPFLESEHGNPSSLHAPGRAARKAVETAREEVAAALGCAPLDVLFTSGGTEADNTAVKGLAWAGREAGRGSHLVTTAIEHHAVLESCEWLAQHQGFELTIVPPESDGVVDPDRVLDAVRSDTVLVSVMAANNELGTIQPLEAIGPALAERGVPLHTDAVQAFGRTPLDLAEWGIGALALSAHKLNGPKGVGVLMLRRGLGVQPLLHGGGQERGVRSGTFNAAGIVGCGAAMEMTVRTMAAEIPRLARLAGRLREGLLAVGGVSLNGSLERRLPHNVNVAVGGCDGEALLLALDAAGVAASTGSACQSGAAEPSHVLQAVGAPVDAAHLRFTCGRTTTDVDVDAAATAFSDCVKRLRDGGGGFV